jgi:hypothetical protein
VGWRHLDSHFWWLPQCVVNRAMVDHLRERFASLGGQGRRLHQKVDLPDSSRIGCPDVPTGHDEALCPQPMPTQEAGTVEGDAPGKAGEEEFCRGGGGVIATILDRLVRAELVPARLYQQAISTLMGNTNGRGVGAHQMMSAVFWQGTRCTEPRLPGEQVMA